MQSFNIDNKNIKSSALALKELLDTIQMESVSKQSCYWKRQYHILHGSFQHRNPCPFRSREQRYELGPPSDAVGTNSYFVSHINED